MGVGHGLSFTPTVARLVAVVGRRRLRMTGLSVAGCGAATGGIVFAAVTRSVSERLGGEWMLRVVGAVVGVDALVVQLLVWRFCEEAGVARLTRKGKKRVRGGRMEWRVLKDGSYVLYSFAMFLVFASLWIPYFYARAYTSDVLHLDASHSFALLVVLNAAGIPGRIAPALLADTRVGTINSYILVLLLTSTTLLCWPLVSTGRGMFIWTGAYGFCAGGAVSLLQAGAVSLWKDDAGVANTIAIVFCITGLASLIGAPVGAQLIALGKRLINDSSSAFLPLQLFTGGLMMLGCVALIAAKALRTGCNVLVRT